MCSFPNTFRQDPLIFSVNEEGSNDERERKQKLRKLKMSTTIVGIEVCKFYVITF